MKRILPKGLLRVGGIGPSPLPCILASPQTTIIFTPSMTSGINLGPSQIGSIILPSPPTSTIALSTHNVPQPTPVMLPLTTTNLSPANIQLPCSVLQPRKVQPKPDLEIQKSARSFSSRASVSRKQSCRKVKSRSSENNVISILPKISQVETKSLVMLSSSPMERLPEASTLATVSLLNQVESLSSKPSRAKSTKKRILVRKTKLKYKEVSIRPRDAENSFATVTKGKIIEENSTECETLKIKAESREVKSPKTLSSITAIDDSLHSSLIPPGVPSATDSHLLPHTVPYHPPPPYPQYSFFKTERRASPSQEESLVSNSEIIKVSSGNAKVKCQKNPPTSKKLSDRHKRQQPVASAACSLIVPEKVTINVSSPSKLTKDEQNLQLAFSQAYADTFLRNDLYPPTTSTSMSSVLTTEGKSNINKSLPDSSCCFTQPTPSCSSACSKSQQAACASRTVLKPYPVSRGTSHDQSHILLPNTSCSSLPQASPSKCQSYGSGYYTVPPTHSPDIGASSPLLPSTPTPTSYSHSLVTTNDANCLPLSSETSTLAHPNPSYSYATSYSESLVSELANQSSHQVSSQQPKSVYAATNSHESFNQSLQETLASVLPEPDAYIPPVHTILYPKPHETQGSHFSHETLPSHSPHLSPGAQFSHSNTLTPSHPSPSYVQVTHMESDQPSIYTQSHQPPSYTQSPQSASHTQSPHPPLYTQSSRPSPFLQSPQPVLTPQLHHQSIYSQSPQADVCNQSSCLSTYTQAQHSDSCLQTGNHSPYIESPQPVVHQVLTQHSMGEDEPQSPRAMPFSASCTASYCGSPRAEALSHSPHAAPPDPEEFHSRSLFRNGSRSPQYCSFSAPRMMQPQHYINSPVPYSSHQTDDTHDLHYYTAIESKSFASSLFTSGDINASVRSLDKCLSPPSYESHLQCTAAYITSSSNTDNTISSMSIDHQQSAPANYSPASQILKQEGVPVIHPISKKVIGSPPAYPSSSTLLDHHQHPPPPPTYNYNHQTTPTPHHVHHASVPEDTGKSISEYYGKESTHQYFPSASPIAPIPHSDTSFHTSTHSYCHSISHGTSSPSGFPSSSYLPSHGLDQSGSTLQQNQDKRYLPLEQEVVPLEHHTHEDYLDPSWNSSVRDEKMHNNESVKVHNLIERAEKLWFIPSQEQNRVYTKRKELARNLLNHPDMHTSRDLMLKEKFWIEEDEPIAEEILVSSLQAVCEEEQRQGEAGTGEGLSADHTFLPPDPTHATQTKKKIPREMLCQVCGKILKGRSSLKCHLNSHRNIQPHKCPCCSKRFTNRSVLAEHHRTHTGEMPFTCSFCDATFRTRSGLLRHKSIHTNARPFECSMCSKSFKTKLVLQQHMKLHLTGLFACPECGKTFERHKSLMAHKVYHHHKSQRYMCKLCHKGYYYRRLLTYHMQLHSSVRKHVCSVCSESFVWRSGLVAHMRTHSTSRPQCGICGKRFASEKRLESHSRAHTNAQSHQCKVCGKIFSHAYRLASHSHIHQEHKEYACGKCGMLLTSTKKLRKHLTSHRKEELRGGICKGLA